VILENDFAQFFFCANIFRAEIWAMIVLQFEPLVDVFLLLGS